MKDNDDLLEALEAFSQRGPVYLPCPRCGARHGAWSGCLTDSCDVTEDPVARCNCSFHTDHTESSSGWQVESFTIHHEDRLFSVFRANPHEHGGRWWLAEFGGALAAPVADQGAAAAREWLENTLAWVEPGPGSKPETQRGHGWFVTAARVSVDGRRFRVWDRQDLPDQRSGWLVGEIGGLLLGVAPAPTSADGRAAIIELIETGNGSAGPNR